MSNWVKQAIKSRLRSFILSTVSDELSSLTDKLVTNYYVMDQLFYDVANYVVYNQIKGDYLEFGVYRGDGFAQMYQRLLYQWRTFEEHANTFGHQYDQDYWQNKRFFAFDSFRGLPDTLNGDKPIHYQAGVYRTSLDSFLENIQKKDVDLSKVVAVSGWFDEVLTHEFKCQHDLAKACLIFIDCDLYESSVSIFDFITDLLQDGTAIIIDDYFRYSANPRKGIQRALREWLAKNSSIAVSELTRCSANRVAFVCHKEH
jgi:O-methyltransferase